MFIYRSRFLTRGEVWFDDEPDGARVDWVYHRQRTRPLIGQRSREVYTRVIDLQRPPAGIRADMEAKTVRKIEEAEAADHLRWERCAPHDVASLDHAEAMWNEFAAAQHTPPFERAWINQIFAAGALDIAAARDPAGNVLAYHLVYLTRRRARQLIAISPYRPAPSAAWRNVVSRANCFIHWKNFLTYREKGIECFDFGGWHQGKTDIRLLGINRFKAGFGGRVVREFDCEQPVTLKGWFGLNLARALARLNHTRPTHHSTSRNRPNDKAPENREVSPAF
jgi:hypothetical protein